MSERLSLQEISANISPYHDQAPVGSEWRHVRTGGLYIVINHAVTSDDDMTPTVVYAPWTEEGLNHPVVFVRPASEFFDGRFIRWAV